MADLETLYCAYCGSDNIEIRMWVNPNTNEIGNDCGEDECWCNNCEDHNYFLTLPQLWDRFSQVSVNENDEIEEDFLCFKKGTSKFDVWHWFDERCPNNLHDDLMYNENTEG